MKKLTVLLVLAGLAGGGYWWFYKRARQVPNLAFQDARGNPVNLEALRGKKDYLLAVFVLPGCPLSKFSLDLIKGQLAQWSPRLAVIGLHFGTREQAEAFRTENALSFPVFGLRSAADPFAVNELIKMVSSAVGTQDAVYGGTVIVLDHRLRARIKLAREDTRRLPEQIEALP